MSDSDIEARIVAMLLGEVSAPEQAELEKLIESDPELKAFYQQIDSTHGLLSEVTDEEPWQLPNRERADLLATLAAPAEPKPKFQPVPVLIAAAAVAILGIVSTVILKPETKTVSGSPPHIPPIPIPEVQSPGTSAEVEETISPRPSQARELKQVATMAPKQIGSGEFQPNTAVEVTKPKATNWVKTEALDLQGADPPIEPAATNPQTPEGLAQSVTVAKAEHSQLIAKKETAVVKLAKAREIYQTLPEILAIHQQMSAARAKIQHSENKIAYLEELKSTATQPEASVSSLLADWQARNKIPYILPPATEIQKLPPIISKNQTTLQPKSSNQIDIEIAELKAVLEHLANQQNQIDDAINTVFPNGQYQSPKELRYVLAAMSNNHRTNQIRYNTLENEVARLLVGKGLDIEIPEDSNSPSAKTSTQAQKPLQTKIDKVYHRWAFVVIQGGQDIGIKPGDRFTVRRNGMVVGKLNITKVDADKSVAQIVPGSLASNARMAEGDQITREDVN